jgi:hypothetical protein
MSISLYDEFFILTREYTRGSTWIYQIIFILRILGTSTFPYDTPVLKTWILNHQVDTGQYQVKCFKLLVMIQNATQGNLEVI